MRIYLLVIAAILCTLISCDGKSDKEDNSMPKQEGWTPVDSNTAEDIVQDHLPNVTEEKPHADSILSQFLPDKIYDYAADKEIQNADHKTNTGQTIKSVVRVYRKGESMIGINVSDFSILDAAERKAIFEYSFKTLSKLSRKKAMLTDVSLGSNIVGKVLYNESANKAIMILTVNDELLFTMSSDTKINLEKFKNIIHLIDFNKLKKIKHIS